MLYAPPAHESPRATSVINCCSTTTLVFSSPYFTQWVSVVAQTVKNLSVMQETRVQSLGQKDYLIWLQHRRVVMQVILFGAYLMN